MRDLDVAAGFDLGTANFGWAVVRRYPKTTPIDSGAAFASSWGYVLLASGVVHTSTGTSTKPGTPDSAFAARKSHDDLRRLREISAAVDRIVLEHHVGVIGFEQYTVFDDNNIEGLKDAAKRVVGIFGGASKAAPSSAQLVAALSLPTVFERLMSAVSDMGESIQKMRTTRGRGAAAKVLAVQGLVCRAAFEREIQVLPFSPADLKRRATGVSGGSKDDVMRGLAKIVDAFDAGLSYLPATHRNHAADAVGHALMALEHSNVSLRGGASEG